MTMIQLIPDENKLAAEKLIQEATNILNAEILQLPPTMTLPSSRRFVECIVGAAMFNMANILTNVREDVKHYEDEDESNKSN